MTEEKGETATETATETTADDALSQAASEAVEPQTEEQTEAVEVEQETVEEDAEGLPTDHIQRSDLGRKITAYHRRQDEFDDRIDRLLGVMETRNPEITEQEVEPDEFMTYEGMNKFLDDRERTRSQKTQDYDKNYVASIGRLSSDLSEQEYGSIFAEMQTITYNPSNDPARDAEMNFLKAERAFLRKQLAGKKVNPLKGANPRSALGGITGQKAVVKESALPKLDAAGKSYLSFVSREDGAEKATELHKSVG